MGGSPDTSVTVGVTFPETAHGCVEVVKYRNGPWGTLRDIIDRPELRLSSGRR